MSKNMDTILALGAVAGGAYIIYKLTKGFEGLGSGVSQVGESAGDVAEQTGKTAVSIIKIPEQLAGGVSGMLDFMREWQEYAGNKLRPEAVEKAVEKAVTTGNIPIPITPAISYNLVTKGISQIKQNAPSALRQLSAIRALPYNILKIGYNYLKIGKLRTGKPTGSGAAISGEALKSSMLYVAPKSSSSRSKSSSLKKAAPAPKRKTIRLTSATLAALSQHKSLRRAT